MSIELEKIPHAFIVANPKDHAPTPGSTIRYRLEFKEMDASVDAGNPEEVEGPEPLPRAWADEFRKAENIELFEKAVAQKFKKHVHWYVIWDRHSQDWKKIKKKEKNDAWRKIRSGSLDCRLKWPYRGKHIVVCILGNLNGKDVVAVHKRHPSLVQHVSSIHVVHGKAIQRQKASPPHPIRTLNAVSRMIEVLEEAEPLTKKADARKVAEYQKQRKALSDYKNGMQQLFPDWELLVGADYMFIPIFASYVAKDTSRQQDVRLCLEVPFKLKSAQVTAKIYDWTNPEHKDLRGVFSAKADSLETAIRRAMRTWEKKREDQHAYFHPGHFEWRILNQKAGAHTIPFISDVFHTTGPGLWDKLEDFFSALALPATIAAIVASILPFPGARVLAGSLWTYVFSTTTSAAVIRIGLRHGDGIHSIKDDALDVLEIAGSLFGAAQLKWVQRAVFTKTIDGKKLRFLLYGDVGTAGIEGMVVAAEHAQEFLAIIEDETLTPTDRLDRILGVLGRGLASAAMTYVSVRSAKGDLKTLEQQLDAERLEKLSRKTDIDDPSQDVDLDERPRVKRHTDDKHVRVKTEDNEIETETARDRQSKLKKGGKKARPRRTDFPPSASSKSRGMRPSDDLSFREAAVENGQHIFVREGNPASADYIGKPGYEGKPVELKAKTATSGKHAGLAVADPDDAGLKKMLRQDEKYGKIKSPKARYKAYVRDLEQQGFKVDPGNGFLVTWKNKPDSKGFYSDYDLHGVYDGKTGTHADAESLKESINERAEQPVVRHGDHDSWPERANRNKSGANYGPQPPVTVYAPDGKAYRLATWKDMKDYARAQTPPLKLEAQYKGIRWKVWRRRRREAGKSDEM